MLILILGIAIVTLVISLRLRVKYPNKNNLDMDAHDFLTVISWILGFGILGLIIVTCCISIKITTESTIDNKIEMYQKENANIEQEIDKVVKEYLKYKYNTATDLEIEKNSITILFSELKSNILVQQQLEIYVSNDAKIESLKKEKSHIAKLKWLLYFGK